MATAVLPLCVSPVVGGSASVMVTTLLQAITALHCGLTVPSVWPEDYGPIAAVEGLVNYDFVVIGGGIAGSVVASRMSENPDVKVLLLEAGHDPTTESEIPALFFTTHRGPSVYEYETEPTEDACLGTKTATCYWPIPKVMGGLSSIDYLFSLRGNKQKFSKWNLPTWSWEEVTKYYDLSERFQSPRGRLIINAFEQFKDTCHISEMVLNGFEELGVSRLPPFVESNEKVGIGYVKGFIKNGQRMGAGKSYLSVVKSRPNIDVIKNAEVKKINFDDLTVSSVTFVLNGVDEITVGVDNEAILAAGPIGNAKLLLLSGIGPAAELSALGIPTVVDLPGVGKNLQDELGVPVPFQLDKFKAKSKTAKERQIDTFYYLTDRYGPLSTLGPTPQIGFINGDKSCAFKNCPSPDLNIVQWYSQRNDVFVKIFSNVADYSDEISQSLEQANRDGNVLLSLVINQNPKSVGHLALQSADYRDKVSVFANYLQDERDMESLLQGIKFQMELEKTEAYRHGKAKIIKLDISGCNDLAFKSDEYWRCYIRHMGSSMFTPSGTTKMGIDTDRQAVVDLRLNVRGVNGLRAAGSSVFVTPVTSSNTDAMVAERLVAFLKEDYGLK